MPKLTIIKNGNKTIVEFNKNTVLDRVLEAANMQIPHPCSSKGRCGKCSVEISGQISPPNQVEKKFGVRLSCQAVLLGDATVILPDDSQAMNIETNITRQENRLNPMSGKYGVAIDIGTTTIAAKGFDLESGECLGTSSHINPQVSVSADVMGRIDAAINGKSELLKNQINEAIAILIKETLSDKKCDSLVLTGNTTMLYLLQGINPKSLSCAPFIADTLFDCDVKLFDANTYLPPCMNAFVGADITCAVLASKMCESDEISLLCDIGTNGEIALWKNGVLYVTSTAAGPAFEGAGISCGCSSISGAIDKVWYDNGIRIHTIDGKDAVGICGSGLLDAIKCGLEQEYIDETGCMDSDLVLSNSVVLKQEDVRAVQLAKAAIAAGIATLLEDSMTPVSDIKNLYITGGFGSHLDVNSAIRIGLLPEELSTKARVLGNAALAGAVSMLLDKSNKEELKKIAKNSKHINLGGNPTFNNNYIEYMMFPE